MTEITVEGDNTTDIENLIRRVGYINSRVSASHVEFRIDL